MKSKTKALAHILTQDLPPLLAKLESHHINDLALRFENWLKQHQSFRPETIWEQQFLLAQFLPLHINDCEQQLSSLKRHFADCSRRYTRATTASEQQEHIIEFARLMGRDARPLRGDRRALRRWFDRDAIADRYQRTSSQLEKQLTRILHLIH